MNCWQSVFTGSDGKKYKVPTFCIELLFGSSWNGACADSLTWTWEFDSDNSTYANLTGTTEVSGGGYKAEIVLDYYLYSNWTEIRVTPTITNNGNKQISDSKLTWRIQDIEIGSTQEEDYLEIENDDTVSVSSRYGAVTREIRIKAGLNPGHIFVPTGVNQNDAMNLFSLSDLTVTDTAGWKTCEVKIKKTK